MNTETAVQEIQVLDCEQTVRRLWDYLDQQLPALDMQAVDQHLAECKAKCPSHFAFERAFLDVLRTSRSTGRTTDVLQLRVRALMQQNNTSERGEAL